MHLIIEHRNLPRTPGEAHGQPGGGVHVPVKHIQNGIAALCARLPYCQNGFCLLGNLTDVQGPSRKEHHRHIGIDRLHCPEQFHLAYRDFNLCPTGSLPALGPVFSQGKHHQLRLLCQRGRFLQKRLGLPGVLLVIQRLPKSLQPPVVVQDGASLCNGGIYSPFP